MGKAGVALQRAGGALDRVCVALQRTGGAVDKTGVALQRTGGAMERSCHALTLEPAAAHTAGPLILNSALSTRIILLQSSTYA